MTETVNQYSIEYNPTTSSILQCSSAYNETSVGGPILLILYPTSQQTWTDQMYGTYFNCYYRKNSKIWDTSNNCHNCPKNRKVCCNIALMHPKEADAMANSLDPDQTASSEAV